MHETPPPIPYTVFKPISSMARQFYLNLPLTKLLFFAQVGLGVRDVTEVDVSPFLHCQRGWVSTLTYF
jgi:hypothetical protein